MKQIWNMMRLDCCLLLREKVAVYIMIAPMVMSFLIYIVISSVQDDTLSLAVTADLPAEYRTRLEQSADLSEVADEEALEQRVREFDNIAGVSYAGGQIRLVLQGNEGAAYEKQAAELITAAIRSDPPVFTATDISAGKGYLMRVITAVLLTAPACIGGIISGFNLVTEKETHVVRAYQISPLGYRRYMLARFLMALLTGYLNLLCIALILGVGKALPVILAATLFAIPIFASSPLLIGSFAKDKMGSLSLVKVIMIIFLVLPIASAYTPEALQFCYYPFPMYWHFRLMESIVGGNFNWPAALLTFVSGAAVLLLFALTLRRRLGIILISKQ